MLQVTLLGEQVIADDVSGAIQTRSSRSIALIAYLSAHPGMPQPRQQIARLFWPDSSDAQALTNLRRELHQLRSVLGEDSSLSTGATSLCWQDTESCRVDARVFDTERIAALRADEIGDDASMLTHARIALAVYSGELLPGIEDDWVQRLRARLARDCVDLCDLISGSRERPGDFALAVEAARLRIRIEPLEEVGYRTLMKLQTDLGDRAGAISTYHHCASVLERELGLDPDTQTTELFQRLLDSGNAAVLPFPQKSSMARAGVASARMVGRDLEFNRVLSAWHIAADGHPQLALVSGEAGVGKTRLVTEVADAARSQGALVVSTRCFGTSGRLPLAPVSDWLRDPVIGAAIAGLSPVWRAEVERLVPPGIRVKAASTGSRAKVDAWQRHLFFEGLARALTGTERPTLLVLDNLQWCDEETLSFLAFCLRLAANAPIMVATTVRVDALDHDPLAEWVAQMDAAGLSTEIPLGPLDIDETANLAEMLLARPLQDADAQTLQETTGGFPLYIVEASRAAAIDVEEARLPLGGLPAVLRRRLGQATPLAREVAELAAAVGRDFSLDLITEASDHPADDVVRAVDELWRLRIIRELPQGYDFSHDLLRDVAYSEVSPAQRWLLHRRLAQALVLLHEETRDDISAQLAEQYARGGLRERAILYYQRAADISAGTFASIEAIRLYGEALTILRTLPAGRNRDAAELEILESLTPPLNARYGYSSPQLQAAAERCLTLAEGLARRDSILTSLIGLWTSRFVQGYVIAGHELATRALGMVDFGSELEGQAHFAFAGSCVTLGKPAQALRHFGIACERSQGAPSLVVGSKPDVHAGAWSAHAQWLLGDSDEALATAHNAIALARTSDHPYSLAVALAYAAITIQMGDDHSELGATVTELVVLCDRFGFAYYREWGLILQGWMDGGPSGIRTARRGIDTLKAARSMVRMPYWLSLLADLFARDGRPDAARATLDAALVGGRANHDMWWLPEVIRMRATYDHTDEAVVRLRAGVALSRTQASVAHLRALERDLATRGAGTDASAVCPTF